MFEGMKKLFSKKLSREQMVDQLEETVYGIDREISGLDYDCKQAKRDLDRIVQGGIKAAKAGDSFGKQQSAMELRNQKMIMQTISNKRNQALATKAVAKNSLMKLRYMDKSAVGTLMERVRNIIDSSELQKMVMQQDLDENKLNAWVIKELNISEANSDMMTLEAGEEEKLLEDLAQAESAGDTKKVSELTSKLTALQIPDEEASKYDSFEVS